MGHGRIPVETLLDHGISASTNVSKLSVDWLIRKMLMVKKEKFKNFLFLFYLFFGGAVWIRNLT